MRKTTLLKIQPLEKRGVYIYIKTNKTHQCFDIGVVDNIVNVLLEQRDLHRNLITCEKLVYYEHGYCLKLAMTRVQKLIEMPKSKLRALIERHNPSWLDLGSEWFR